MYNYQFPLIFDKFDGSPTLEITSFSFQHSKMIKILNFSLQENLNILGKCDEDQVIPLCGTFCPHTIGKPSVHNMHKRIQYPVCM